MKEKKWSDAKVEGAKQHCLKKKLTKECPYEKVKKYLVLVSDDVQKLWWQVKTNYFIAELFAPFKFQIKTDHVLLSPVFSTLRLIISTQRKGDEKMRELEEMMENAGPHLCIKKSYSTQYIYIYTI